MILVNTTSRKIWIRQPLLAAEIYEAEFHPWQYHVNLNREDNDTNFQLTIPLEIEHDLQSNQVEAKEKSVTSEVQENPQPTFEPHPDMS